MLPADIVSGLGLGGSVEPWVMPEVEFVPEERERRFTEFVAWMRAWLVDGGIPADSIQLQLDMIARDIEMSWRMVEGIRSLARRGRIDLLIVNADYALPRRPAVLAAKECGIPVVSVEHGHYAPFPDPDVFRESRRPFVPIVPDVLMLDNVIEENWHAKLSELEGERGCLTLPLGMPNDSSTTFMDRAEARLRLGIEGDAPVVLVPMTWLTSFRPSTIHEEIGEDLAFFEQLFAAVVDVAPNSILLFKTHPALSESAVFDGVNAFLRQLGSEFGHAGIHVVSGALDECIDAADLLVCPAITSVVVDALDRNRPSIVCFMPSLQQSAYHGELLPVGNELARQGLVRNVLDLDQLVGALRDLLAEGAIARWEARLAQFRRETGMDVRSTEDKCVAISTWIAEDAPLASVHVPETSRYCPSVVASASSLPDDRVDAAIAAELETLPKYYRHVRQEILDAIPCGVQRILDVGCAAGVLGNAVRKRDPGCHVTGVEVMPDAAAVASRLLDRFYHADVESFDPPFREGEFDCIVFADVLEHTRDPWRLVGMYRRFLRPGGCMVISIPNIRYLDVAEALLGQGRWEYADEGILDRTHLRFFTLREFGRLLEEQGMAVRSVRPLMGDGKILHSRGPDGVVRWGRIAIGGVTDGELLELGTFQFLFVASPMVSNPVAVKDALREPGEERAAPGIDLSILEREGFGPVDRVTGKALFGTNASFVVPVGQGTGLLRLRFDLELPTEGLSVGQEIEILTGSQILTMKLDSGTPAGVVRLDFSEPKGDVRIALRCARPSAVAGDLGIGGIIGRVMVLASREASGSRGAVAEMDPDIEQTLLKTLALHLGGDYASARRRFAPAVSLKGGALLENALILLQTRQPEAALREIEGVEGMASVDLLRALCLAACGDFSAARALLDRLQTTMMPIADLMTRASVKISAQMGDWGGCASADGDDRDLDGE